MQYLIAYLVRKKTAAMNKSVIITISIVWICCTMYFTLAGVYNFPYPVYAMAGSWIASALLLICIIMFIRKHKAGKKNEKQL
jgi:hypothetical protein